MASRTTMVYSALLSAVAGIAVVSAACSALAQDPPSSAWICPESIQVDQRLAVPLAGWEQRRSAGMNGLEFVTVYDGHPNEGASLVPDAEEERSGGRGAAIWNLEASKRGYWVECAYRKTDVVIYRRLPVAARRCEVVVDERRLINGRPAIVDARCR